MITAIDKHTALVIIDLQKGIMKMPVAGLNKVVENAARLVEAFRKEGLPIVAVNVVPVAPKRLTRKDSNVAASTLQAATAMHEFSDITIIRCGTNNDLYYYYLITNFNNGHTITTRNFPFGKNKFKSIEDQKSIASPLM